MAITTTTQRKLASSATQPAYLASTPPIVLLAMPVEIELSIPQRTMQMPITTSVLACMGIIVWEVIVVVPSVTSPVENAVDPTRPNVSIVTQTQIEP